MPMRKSLTGKTRTRSWNKNMTKIFKSLKTQTPVKKKKYLNSKMPIKSYKNSLTNLKRNIKLRLKSCS